MKNCPVVALDHFGLCIQDGASMPDEGFIRWPRYCAAASEGYIAIRTAEDLRQIAANPAGKYILLDYIDISDCGFLNEVTFEGVLEGNGCVLYDMDLRVNEQNGKSILAGLFRMLRGATVRNLKVEGRITVESGGGGVGAIAGVAVGSSVIENCVTAVDITCTKGAIVRDDLLVGGMVGRFEAGSESALRLCRNMGNIDISLKFDRTSHIGGIVGELAFDDWDTEKFFRVFGCRNDGRLDMGEIAGGIVGVIWQEEDEEKHSVLISECENDGHVFSKNIAGGILAGVRNGGGLLIMNCLNKGTINAHFSGGIVPDGFEGAYSCRSEDADHPLEQEVDMVSKWFKTPDMETPALRIFDKRLDRAYGLSSLYFRIKKSTGDQAGQMGIDAYRTAGEKYPLAFDPENDANCSCQTGCRAFADYAAMHLAEKPLSEWRRFPLNSADASALMDTFSDADILEVDGRYSVVMRMKEDCIRLLEAVSSPESGSCRVGLTQMSWEEFAACIAGAQRACFYNCPVTERFDADLYERV